MLKYRDKFVAHQDALNEISLPRLDAPKAAVWFYHAYIVTKEAEPSDLAGLQVELDRGFHECEEQANAVYGRACQ